MSNLVESLRTARSRGECPSAPRANLRGADLRDANLRDVDLRDADLWGANLRGADLWGADLRDANLRDVDLRDVRGGVLQVTGLPSGQAILVPTCDGWRLSIGCWGHVDGTVESLRELIASDEGWPEASGAEVARRRPMLAALADMCDAHIAGHVDELAAVAHWGEPSLEAVAP